MTTPSRNPAQRQLVHQRIDWKRVQHRRTCHPAIGRTFPMNILERGCESSPYYCHYMSWRLGTWEDDCVFQRLEELLCCAELLPNWEYEKTSLVNSTDFAEFWSLVWQLQVAEYLCEVGSDVCWAKSGPDLSVKVDEKRLYVECYTPRKSFGLLGFLEELLQKLDPHVRTYYDLCLPFQLPRNSDRSRFLDGVLNRFLDPSFLAKAQDGAKTRYPVILYKGPEQNPKHSLYIYVDGDNGDAYMPGIVPNQTGDPEFYFEHVLQEAIDAKGNSNALEAHHPNLLAVNYSLSADFQLARMLLERVQPSTLPRIAHNIDTLAIYVVGINERLTNDKVKVVQSSNTSTASSGRVPDR